MATTTTISKEPPQQPPQPVSSSSPEDEYLKRNTDCVYFLASPLTCKKGSECDFRHSEKARMNPVDCYYWLSGNCLNPKCAYRHPPLDGLVPPQAGNFAGPFPHPVPSGASVSSTPQNTAKQAVPCVFFQQGFCLKGDRCPFLHGPASTKIQQGPAAAAAIEAPTFKKTFGGLEKCTQPKPTFQANAPKMAEAPRQPPQAAKAAPKAQVARRFEGAAPVKRLPPPASVIDEAPKHRGRIGPPVDNGSLRGRAVRPHPASSVDDHSYQNGRDIDDAVRESSPGFDVLVDDKLREEEYYPNEDQYVRMRGHEGTSLNEFDGRRHDEYNPVAKVDTEIYRSRRGYDSYDASRDKYGWDQRGTSPERPLGEPAHYDRRSSYKSRSPDFTQNSDLRHRLSKQRKGNGLRSVVNPDHKPDIHSEDLAYRSSRRDYRRSPVRENSTGSRLQGRLKLPRRSPPLSGHNMYSERENERGRIRGRSSPSRPQVPSHQGRLRDRLSSQIQDESIEGRNFRGQMRKESVQGDGGDFAPPKSLSELKGPRISDHRQQQQLTPQQSVVGGKLRDTVLATSFGSDNGLSFDAPKPLSEILKRKRGAGATAPAAGARFDNKETDVHIENNAALSSGPERTQAVVEENNKPYSAAGDEEEGEISNKKTKFDEDESSIPNNEKQPEIEEGSVVGEGDEQEYEEEYDQGDGEYEYENDDTEGYNLNEEEPADHEGDFMDEDDGDDFAKKLGVSF